MPSDGPLRDRDTLIRGIYHLP